LKNGKEKGGNEKAEGGGHEERRKALVLFPDAKGSGAQIEANIRMEKAPGISLRVKTSTNKIGGKKGEKEGENSAEDEWTVPMKNITKKRVPGEKKMITQKGNERGLRQEKGKRRKKKALCP